MSIRVHAELLRDPQAAREHDRPDRTAGERAPERHAARLPRGLGVGDRDGGVDQREVRERLREVAEEVAGARVDLLRVEPDVVREPDRARPSARSRRRAGQRARRASTSQNEQVRNAPSSPAERRRRRGSDRRTAPRAALARRLSIVDADPLALRVAVAEQRQRQQARVQLAQVGRAHVALQLLVPALRLDEGSRSSSAAARQRSLRSGIDPRSASLQARSSATQQSAFDWMKCVGSLAHLPDPRVVVAPVLAT